MAVQHRRRPRVSLDVRALRVIFPILVAGSYADAHPVRVVPPAPLEDVLDNWREPRRVGLDFDFANDATSSHTPHIIDVDRMHALDCRLDRIQGGSCVLGWDDDVVESRIDVDGYAKHRARRYRFELIEQILDGAELVE